MATQKISELTGLVDINSGDLIVVSEDDGAGGYDSKKYDLGDTADAISKKHAQNTDTGFGVFGTKNPPLDADLAIYRDSTAASAPVTSTWTQIKAFLKTYFDTVYVDKVVGSSLLADTEAAKLAWSFAAHTISGNQSGDVTITPANGHRQSVGINGAVTSLICALSATYPAIVLEITTTGDFALDLSGWQTDGGGAIVLPTSGKCILVLQLSADGTTQYAYLAATEVA